MNEVSAPARVADPGEGISAEEMRLAGRTHALPLEALHGAIGAGSREPATSRGVSD